MPVKLQLEGVEDIEWKTQKMYIEIISDDFKMI